MAKLTLEIGAKITELQKVLGGVGRSFKNALASVAGQVAGVFAAGKLVAFGREAINAADNIGKASKRTGVSAEEWQKLSYAADMSGSSMEQVEVAMKTLGKTVYEAGNGMKSSKDALAALGLGLTDLQGKGAEEQFQIVAKALNKIEDASLKTALATEVFGRSGNELIPMLTSYASLASELESSGNMISNESVAAAEAFNDAMTKLTQTLQSGLMESGLVEWLSQVAEGMNAVVGMSNRLGFKSGIGAPGSAGYRGGVSGFFSNMKDAFWGESEGVQIKAEDTEADKKKLADAKKEFDASGGKNLAQRNAEAEAAATKAREDAKLAEEKKKADEKLRKEQEKQLEKEKAGYADSISALEQRIQLQRLLNEGKEKEAQIQEAINAAEDKMGRKLTSDETSKISDLAGTMFDLSKKEKKDRDPLSMGRLATSDSLARIGGRLGGGDASVNYDRMNNGELKSIRKNMEDLNRKTTAVSGGKGALWP